MEQLRMTKLDPEKNYEKLDGSSHMGKPMIRANLSALAARFIIPTETQGKLALQSPEPSSNSRFPSGSSGGGEDKKPGFL
jgi:hypothetical protein